MSAAAADDPGGAGPSEASLRAVLKKYWGHSDFRPNQLEVVKNVIFGRDVLAFMATGMGKSLTYQLPALALRESAGYKCVGVVVSPLISLMQDQVVGLRSNGIPAVALTGESAGHEVREQAVRGEYALVYLSPEGLEGAWDLLTRMKDTVGIVCFAVDECHCISQWGHSFRSSYLKLGTLRERFPEVPIIALSATATPEVQEDVAQQLHLEEPFIVRSTINRPNLHYAVVEKGPSEEADLRRVLCETCPKGCAIVYVLTKKEAESVADLIQRRLGVSAAAYHGGMSDAARRDVQEKWAGDKIRCVVATVAFGMGVDKGDVRLIVNWGLPKSVENLQQMWGRAGRDGIPSRCFLLYAEKDAQMQHFLLSKPDPSSGDGGALDPEVVKVGAAKIQEMQKFARAPGCRRKALLQYFGEELQREAPPARGTCCDFCDMGLAAPAAGEKGQVVRGALDPACYVYAARMVVKATDRMGTGAAKVLKLLLGSEAKELRERRDWEQLKASDVWGVAKKMPGSQTPQGESWWKAWIKQCADSAGLVAFVTKNLNKGGTYQALEVTPKGRAFLAAGDRARLDSMVASQALVDAEAVALKEQQLAQQRAEQAEHARAVREQERQAARAKEERLVEALMAARAAEADRVGVKAYQVADEPQLRALARARPSTLEAFAKAQLEGWPEAKVQKHGPAFVAALVAGCQELGLAMDVVRLQSSYRSPGPATALVRDLKWTPAVATNYEAFMVEQRSVHDIATTRAKPIKEATVRGYLAQAAQMGREVDWDRMQFPGGLLPAVQHAIEHLLNRQGQGQGQKGQGQEAGGAGEAAAGATGPAALHTRALKEIVPDYWSGQEAQWGDVEAAHTCILQRQYQAVFASPDGSAATTAPAAPAGGGKASQQTPPVGAWLTTRKRPFSSSPGAAPAGAAAATTGGGGGGGAGKKIAIYVPSYGASATASTNTSPPAAAAAAAAEAPKPQPPTAAALVAALSASVEGLTQAELEAQLGGPVGPGLASLQEEGVVYQSGQGRFLLL